MSTEVILPRRAHAQPSPHRVAVGDCGACVLGGLMGLTVDQTYALVCGPRTFPLSSGPRSIGWQEMREVVGAAETKGTIARALTDIPIWPNATPSACLTWGVTAPWQSRAWWGYVTTAIDAGLYGLACVSFKGAGSDSEGPDHWVLLVGYRRRVDGSQIRDELLVSCSARHPEGRWVDRNDFLRKWGGFNTLWARPA